MSRFVHFGKIVLIPLLVAAACLCSARPAIAQDALTITAATLPSATTGSHYQFTLPGGGGVTPYTWHVADGSKLPPGFKLHPHTGNLTGIPTAAGEYHFAVALSDSNAPPSHVQRDFTLVVVAGLTLDWKLPPKVDGTKIGGSLVVGNHTEHSVQLTVIVVAVNQIGRATALGYQHFTLRAQAEQEIPFGASPGPGSYVVNADAVAQHKSRAPTRVHKQTPDGSHLVIDQI